VIAIRKALASDAEALGRLGAEMVRFHHRLDPARFFAMPEPIEPGYARFLVGEIRDARAIVLVAVTDDGGHERVVGYAFARMEPRSWEALRDACGVLHDVLVDASARRQGAGRALVREAVLELEAMGAPRVVLSSAWSNREAQALFASLGFRPTMVEMTRERGG
jgi:ribosomal protein S18 acetylase RimI-like enzyme